MPRVLVSLGLAAMISLPTATKAQTVPVPESIRAEGVPPVAPRPLASASRTGIRTSAPAAFQDWDDAKGRAMYVTTRFADTPQVHHVALPGAPRRQLTFQPERVRPSASAQPQHDQFLYRPWTRGRRELPALPPRSHRRRAAADHRRQEPQHRPPLVSLGRAPGLERQRPQRPRHGPLPRRAGRSPTSGACSRRSPANGPWPTGRPTSRRSWPRRYLSIQESYLHVIDVASGRVATHHPPSHHRKAEPSAAADAPRWSKDGKSIYFLTDRGSEFRRLARHDLVTGKDHSCAPLATSQTRVVLSAAAVTILLPSGES